MEILFPSPASQKSLKHEQLVCRSRELRTECSQDIHSRSAKCRWTVCRSPFFNDIADGPHERGV